MRMRRIIICAAAVALAAPIWAGGQVAQSSAQTSRFGALLQPYLDRRELAGIVTLVASKDKILSLEAIGYGDLASKRPMRTDDFFWIASQSKPITATAFMMLVDEGKVAVDDPVEKYLPEFKGQMMVVERDSAHVLLKPPPHPITIRDLLTHTSGLPWRSPIEGQDLYPLATRVKSYAMLQLQFEPGTKYSYSNAGISIVGRIIEVVSGIPYADFMQQRLFTPLGMTQTTFWPSKAQLAKLATSYTPNADKTGLREFLMDQLTLPLDDPQRQPMPSGGLFSTATDVARFCQMILNGGTFEGRRYLSEAAIAEMTRTQTGPTITPTYGLGWQTKDGMFGHDGARNTHMMIDPQHGLIFVFLVQNAGTHGKGFEAWPAFQQAAIEAFGTR
jgi:CubicO group peptidase (beta-lactamase class C family)